MPASGRKNQLAEAGVAITADSSRSVVIVVFFIALSCEFDPFRDRPPQGTARHHAEPHRRKRANGCEGAPSGRGQGRVQIAAPDGTKRRLPLSDLTVRLAASCENIAGEAIFACAAIQRLARSALRRIRGLGLSPFTSEHRANHADETGTILIT